MLYEGKFMRISDLIQLAIRTISDKPKRTLLTTLGIAVGIFAVTLLTSLGSGVQSYILNTFSQFGTRIVAVTPGKSQVGGLGGILANTQPLTIDDALALQRVPGVEHVVPIIQGSGAIEFDHRTRHTDILGVSSVMPQAWNFNVEKGAFLPDSNGSFPKPMAVLGSKVAQELFRETNPLGEFIRAGGERYRVVGVLESKGQMLGFDLDDIVYIDTERALNLFNRDGVMEIDITFAANYTSEQISKPIKETLIRRHKGEDFTLMSQDQMLDTLDRILSVLKFAIAGLAGISLLVGSIGILTVMSTNIQERKAEIGLMRALGADKKTILSLFLTEATIFSLFGGLLGVFATLATVTLLNIVLPSLPVALQFNYLLLALGMAAITGALSGLFPALQAIKIDPIDALQNE